MPKQKEKSVWQQVADTFQTPMARAQQAVDESPVGHMSPEEKAAYMAKQRQGMSDYFNGKKQ